MKISQAVLEFLLLNEIPIVSFYDLYLITLAIYRANQWQEHKLKLRKTSPSRQDVNKIIKILVAEGQLKEDKDLYQRMRVINVSDASVEYLIQLADPFCYISHQSAILFHQLTDKISDDITLTSLTPLKWKEIAAKKIKQELNATFNPTDPIVVPYYQVPKKVRKRNITVHRINRSKEMYVDSR